MSSLSCIPFQASMVLEYAGSQVSALYLNAHLDHMTQLLHCLLSAFTLETLSHQFVTSTTSLVLVNI